MEKKPTFFERIVVFFDRRGNSPARVSLLVFLCATGFCLWQGCRPEFSGINDIAATIVSMCAIAIGFLAAARTFIIGIDDKHPVAIFLRSGDGEEEQVLLQKFGRAMLVSFACASVSVLVMFLVPQCDWSSWWKSSLILLWCYLVLYAFFTALRSILFFALIENKIIENRPK